MKKSFETTMVINASLDEQRHQAEVAASQAQDALIRSTQMKRTSLERHRNDQDKRNGEVSKKIS